jgi:hypothetical protein
MQAEDEILQKIKTDGNLSNDKVDVKIKPDTNGNRINIYICAFLCNMFNQGSKTEKN